MIKFEDITLIVQGAVDRENTPKCLKSIRKYFPGSTIIVSTWEGTNVSSLDYDELLLNIDPGGFKDKNCDFINNIKRQLVSTQNGLAKIKTQYAMKLRSDLIFESSTFLSYFNAFPKREDQYSFFSKRVIFCSFFFKKYVGQIKHAVQPVPFHISDWLAFGLTSDLRKLYNIPLPVEPDNTDYFFHNPYTGIKPKLLGPRHQYSPEQYIGYISIKEAFPDVAFENMLDYSSENIAFFERFVASNCIILNPCQFKLVCNKDNGSDKYSIWTRDQFEIPKFLWEGVYRHDVFLDDYKKYCDINFKTPLRVKLERLVYKFLHRKK